ENLPRFIEAQFRHPKSSEGLAWHEHIADWSDRPNVHHVSYEELLSHPEVAIGRVVEGLTGANDNALALLAAQRWSFSQSTGRRQGEEDRSSFERKGVAGDWLNYFNREAGEVFDAHAGETLVKLGYATNRDWMRDL